MLGTYITEIQYKEIKLYVSGLSDVSLVQCLDSVRAVLTKLEPEQLEHLPVSNEIRFFYECIIDTVCKRFSDFVFKIGGSINAFSLYSDFKNSVKKYSSCKELKDKYCVKCKAKLGSSCAGCVIYARLAELEVKQNRKFVEPIPDKGNDSGLDVGL